MLGLTRSSAIKEDIVQMACICAAHYGDRR